MPKTIIFFLCFIWGTLAHISPLLSDNSHTLSPHLVPQQGGSVLHEHCPHPAVNQSAPTGERFVQRAGEKYGLAAETPDTYFTYSTQSLDQLKSKKSNFRFSKEELLKWDQFVAESFKDQPASLTQFRVCTYLYVAQEEAAKLSEYAQGGLVGSLDPVSYTVIAFFLPEKEKPSPYREDPYSNALAEMIGKKIQARIDEENANQFTFDVPEKLKDRYFVGLAIAKWMPWYAIPARAYWPPQPPPASDKEFWDDQIEQIRKQQKPMTEKKMASIKLWAGMEDPTESDWRIIANRYLFTHDISLDKMLRVRSVLTMGLYDAFIVSFNAKYAYLVLRPSMYDPTLETAIPVPKHPSYPSNHSVTSAAAATILSYFFPAQAKRWHELEKEACMSRIWAAIHYPIDDQEGRKAGKKVAEAVLEELKN